jgi:hypothetical protein
MLKYQSLDGTIKQELLTEREAFFTFLSIKLK